MINNLSVLAYRICFVLAIGFTGVAILDKVIMQFGYKLIWVPYLPARMLEFSTIMILFAVILLLREIRDTLKNKN